MNLKGRVAVITGGAGYLGEAMAHALAEAGAGIIILDVDEALALKKAKLISKQYRVKVDVLKVDLGDSRSIESTVCELKKKYNTLDIFVHAAALVGTSNLKGWGVPFLKQDVDTWRMALEVNLTSAFVLTQAIYPLMLKSPSPSIITIGSIYAFLGPDWSVYKGTQMGNPSAYGASKGGLIQLTKWMATSFAPKVRANSISIGGVLRGQSPSFLSQYKKKTPLKRLAVEEDIKGAVLYLASDMSAYVTGQHLIVDGGYSAW